VGEGSADSAAGHARSTVRRCRVHRSGTLERSLPVQAQQIPAATGLEAAQRVGFSARRCRAMQQGSRARLGALERRKDLGSRGRETRSSRTSSCRSRDGRSDAGPFETRTSPTATAAERAVALARTCGRARAVLDAASRARRSGSESERGQRGRAEESAQDIGAVLRPGSQAWLPRLAQGVCMERPAVCVSHRQRLGVSAREGGNGDAHSERGRRRSSETTAGAASGRVEADLDE